MIRLPAGLQVQKVPRVAAYATLAALMTAALFAADAAYRWYSDPATEVAAPLTGQRSVDAAEPAPEPALAGTQPAAASPQIVSGTPKPETAAQIGAQPATAQAPSASPVTAQAPDANSRSISQPASGSIASPSSDPVSNPRRGTLSSVASAPAPAEAAPQQAEPKPSRQIKRQQVRRPPAKQTARDRATPRRPVQAQKPQAQKQQAQPAKPSVYFERDNQLGFAAELRRRTCNPATGQMPMQCYYPREGRERFPAKPLGQ
jgi:hypothetical protein